jgi:hypothetical protein
MGHRESWNGRRYRYRDNSPRGRRVMPPAKPVIMSWLPAGKAGHTSWILQSKSLKKRCSMHVLDLAQQQPPAGARYLRIQGTAVPGCSPDRIPP